LRSWLQREAAMAKVARQQQQDGSVIKKVQRGYSVKKNADYLIVKIIIIIKTFKKKSTLNTIYNNLFSY